VVQVRAVARQPDHVQPRLARRQRGLVSLLK
jgi:hypothetical protein